MSKKKKKKNKEDGGPAPGEAALSVGGGGVGERSLWFNGSLFLGIASAGALLDILSKSVVFSHLNAKIAFKNGIPGVVSGGITEVFGETLRFRAAVNTGAVFGIFEGRWLFLVIFTLVALGIMGWVLVKSKGAGIMMITGLGLVCAGALGNLWDRFFFNGVRDFIDFTSPLLAPFVPGGRWPTFNIADAWICIGIPLIILGDFLTSRREAGAPESSPVPSTQD